MRTLRAARFLKLREMSTSAGTQPKCHARRQSIFLTILDLLAAPLASGSPQTLVFARKWNRCCELMVVNRTMAHCKRVCPVFIDRRTFRFDTALNLGSPPGPRA